MVGLIGRRCNRLFECGPVSVDGCQQLPRFDLVADFDVEDDADCWVDLVIFALAAAAHVDDGLADRLGVDAFDPAAFTLVFYLGDDGI